MLKEALGVKMKYLIIGFLLLVAPTANAALGDKFYYTDANNIIANGIIIREWIVGDQINMYISKGGNYYACSIRVENETYGEARVWCVEVG